MCAALRTSITGEEPRKQFAFGLTVEQISQHPFSGMATSTIKKWNQQKKVNPSKYKNSNRLTDGQEHKNIYASNAIEPQESGLNRRSSKPSCIQSADGN
jgi:hypothetical protein